MAHPPDTWRLPNDRFVSTNSLNTVSDVTFWCVTCYVTSCGNQVYLLDFAMAHPPDTWRLPNDRFAGANSLNTVRGVTFVGM
jgi:hypothetical protein